MTIPGWKQRQIEIEEQRREERAMAHVALVFGLSDTSDDHLSTLVRCVRCGDYKPKREFPLQNRQLDFWCCASCER